jgi:tetratricopeptide (TPR) repeat protein
MLKPIFFLSHSGKDAELVKRVASKLGKERCWLYEWEAKFGGPIFQYDRGIADSRIFVLFWSKDAALSPGVEEETNQARTRLMRDRGFRLVVVKLDNTTLPDHLAYRVYIDAAKGLDYVCQSLESVAQDLTPEEVFVGKPALRDSFQDREREVDLLERLALSEEHSGIMVLGLDGMGKTSLAKRAIPRLFSHLTPLWVDLATSPTPLRLLSAFARPLGIAIDPENTARDPEQTWRKTLLPEIAQSDKTFVVLDSLTTQTTAPRLESDAMDQLIEHICYDLAGHNKPQNPNVIVICARPPDFTEQTLARYRQLQVGPLDKKSMVRALRYQLSQIGYVDYESEKLELLADELRGYPLALNLAVARVAEHGLDAVLADKFGLHKMVLDLAHDLLAGLSFNPEEKNLLILLATSTRPLSVNWLQIISEEHLSAIDKVAMKQLFDPTSQGYALHGIVSDFVSESMAKPGEIKVAHGQLADLFRNEWIAAPEKSAASAEYGGLACFHALSAGRTEEANNLRMAYLEEAKQAAVESYRRGEYKTTIIYVETMKKMDDRPDPTCDFYYALALNREKRGEEALPIMQTLVKEFPERSNYHHGLGTIYKWLHRNEDALASFRRAVATARWPNSTALASLADLLCDMGNIKEARPFAEEALKIDPAKSHVVSIMSRVLEESGDLEGALDIVSLALRRAPTDARLHGRAGMIFKKQIGRLRDARHHLEQAVSDPTLSFLYTALADVYLQMGDYGKAEEALNKSPGDRWSDAGYLSTRANLLRHRKDFGEAERCLRRALELEKDNPVHYGGMAQLYLDQAREAALKGARQTVLLYIEQTKTFVQKGLSKVADNEALLSIKHAVAQFESNLGLR